jgi:aerobic carbon-monoxide dehydrogenase large subunit
MRQLKFGIGQPHLRVEDPPLVTGKGRFVSDLIPDGALRAVFVRSPHAHAKFKFTDLETARKMPGVRLVLTHEETAKIGHFPCLGALIVHMHGGPKIWVPPYEVLPKDRVLHIGEEVAFVVADTYEQARDAAEAVGIDWEPLPTVVDVRKALEPDAPVLWPEHGSNDAYTLEAGDKEATEQAFAKADRVIKFDLINQRLVTNYMEPRGVVADQDANGRLELIISSQGSHAQRHYIAEMLHMEKSKIRVLAYDVGGGFGTKGAPYRDYVLSAIANLQLGKPVVWISDRTDHFLSDAQGRDNYTTAEVALDKDGRILGLKVDVLANMGSYLSVVAPYVPALGLPLYTGVYKIPAAYVRARGVYSHTHTVDAYRGAGRPEAAYLIERLVDEVARQTNTPPDDVRRKNFIDKSEMPYENPGHKKYDSGDFAGHLARAQDVADWKGFDKRASEAKRNGKLRGIGLSSYIEACGLTAPEDGKVILEQDGKVTVHIGTLAQGQGHKTTYAQIVSQEFDMSLDQIRVEQGDSDALDNGGGTVGSRSMPTGGPVVQDCTRTLVGNIKAAAAKELEADADKLEISDGVVRVGGTNRSISLADMAKKMTPEQRLAEIKNYMPPGYTFPNGTHVCEVELDPETGEIEIARYTVVDDFGVTLNPLLLEGQIHGGIVQGAGQALMENTIYSDDGQLLTASFMDYQLPRAADFPTFHFETRNVPSTTNPLGLKGAGEAGTIGSTPAVMNAVLDVLNREYGIKHFDMPATPQRVWRAIQQAN